MGRTWEAILCAAATWTLALWLTLQHRLMGTAFCCSRSLVTRWSSVALAVICSGTACSRCLQPFADVCRCSIKPEMEEGEESRYSAGNVQCLLVCHPALASLP